MNTNPKQALVKATKIGTMIGAPLLILGSIYQLTQAKGKGAFNGYVMPTIGILTGITAFNAVYNLKVKDAGATATQQSEPRPSGSGAGSDKSEKA